MPNKAVLSNHLAEDPLEGLMYRSYAFQRKNAPLIEATRWRAVYVSQRAFEIRYQKELKKEKENV